jgi:hypothetical protein
MIECSVLPEIPGTPIGEVDICTGSADTTIYSTSGSSYSESYIWEISPVEAGLVSGIGLIGIVSWAEYWEGIATIKVKGYNEICGEGEFSEELIVSCTPIPIIPGTPVGNEEVCTNVTDTTVYITSGSGNAESYIWELLPSEAGIVSGNGLTGTVSWTNNWEGIAIIKVKGYNEMCGEGEFSDELAITCSSVPVIPSIPVGDEEVCTNWIDSTIYVTSGSSNSQSYIWELLPAEVGIISGNGLTGTVYWSENWEGTATIKVKGFNGICGEGEFSEELNVECMICTGSLETENNSSFQIYPNPTSNSVMITNPEFIDGNISIYDLTLHQVSHISIQNQSKVEIDLSLYPKGIYLIKIQWEKNTFFRKIVKN